MHAAETPIALPVWVADAAIAVTPGRLPKPPARPPAEPIIIKVPPRSREDPEFDRPEDGEDDDIRRSPWMPDMPPPLPPEERLHQMLDANRSSLP